MRAAQRAGFGNITADLIFGIPGFGGDSLKRSLDGVLSLGVQHISAYHLTVEPDTAFGRRAARGEFRAVDEEVSEEEFLTVHDTLTAAGFEHYEVSNYALPGFRARHNASYWRGTKYLGIGPAAHSFDGEERHWNASSVEKYIAGAPAGKEVLTRRDRSGRGRGTFRSKTAGADAGRGSTVPSFGYAPHSPGADGPTAGKIPDFGCRDRGTFRNITRHATM